MANAPVDLVPASVQWNMYANQDNVLKITIKNRSTGNPVDITGRTYVAEIFSKDGVLMYTSTGGSPTLDLTNGGTNGVVTITLDKTRSLAATFTQARYDVTETISGIVAARMAGVVTMTPRGLR